LKFKYMGMVTDYLYTEAEFPDVEPDYQKRRIYEDEIPRDMEFLWMIKFMCELEENF
jgi:hypothetical protein